MRQRGGASAETAVPTPAHAPAKAEPKPAAAGAMLKITQVRSFIGFNGKQEKVLRGLGLGRIGRSVTRRDDACIRGMIAKVAHLVAVEKLEV